MQPRPATSTSKRVGTDVAMDYIYVTNDYRLYGRHSGVNYADEEGQSGFPLGKAHNFDGVKTMLGYWFKNTTNIKAVKFSEQIDIASGTNNRLVKRSPEAQEARRKVYYVP